MYERAIDSTAASLRMPPPERIESAIRRGRKIRRRRLALGAMASAVVAAALIVPLLLLLPLHERPAPNPQGSGRLSRFGIGVDLPDGWQGTISYPSGTLGPVLQATNFPLAS